MCYLTFYDFDWIHYGLVRDSNDIYNNNLFNSDINNLFVLANDFFLIFNI